MFSFIYIALYSALKAQKVTIYPIGSRNLALYNENGKLTERMELKLKVIGFDKPKAKYGRITFYLFAAILPAKTYDADPKLFENAVVEKKIEDLKKI